MKDESHLLSELPPGYEIENPSDVDESFYACEMGQYLWEQYRHTHPDAPELPPEMQELWPDPDAAHYFMHTSVCMNCLED